MGNFDTGYSVLKFQKEPHPQLVGMQKVFLHKGETVTVRFLEEMDQKLL